MKQLQYLPALFLSIIPLCWTCIARGKSQDKLQRKALITVLETAASNPRWHGAESMALLYWSRVHLLFWASYKRISVFKWSVARLNYIYIYMFTYIYAYIYVCVYVCICVHINLGPNWILHKQDCWWSNSTFGPAMVFHGSQAFWRAAASKTQRGLSPEWAELLQTSAFFHWASSPLYLEPLFVIERIAEKVKTYRLQ